MAKQIRYIGLAGIRQITAKDWKGVGVSDQEPLVWNAANGWTVPLSKVGASALPFIEADERLVVFDPDSDGDQPQHGRPTEGRRASTAQLLADVTPGERPKEEGRKAR